MFDSTELLIIQQLVNSRQDHLEAIDRDGMPPAVTEACDVMTFALIGISETISNHIEQ